ncbi:MAG: right-handed parallel beta-helix repeat-containing protein, partial [Promethearchaeota archaeon]
MRFKRIKNKSVFILGLVIGILLFQSIFMQSWIRSEGGLDIENGEENYLNMSWYWVLPHTIHVDNNWSDTKNTYDWCSGSGTIGSPYIIENVKIDAQNSGSCIYIANSNDYFIIQNCTLINSQASPNSAIRLDIVSNGKIIDNNCTNNNGRAISLFGASNMFIEDNNVVN